MRNTSTYTYQVRFRVGEMEAPLKDRTPIRGLEPSQVARRDLARYYQLMADELEARITSRNYEPDVMAQIVDLLRNAHGRMSPYLVLDLNRLLDLNDSSPVVFTALLDAVERYWVVANQYEPLGRQDQDTLMRAVGLLPPPGAPRGITATKEPESTNG